jgi:hypothetical protein
VIATNPYSPTTTWFSPTSTCRCTWTVCQCWTRQQQGYYTEWIEVTPRAPSKAKRLDEVRLRAFKRAPERVRLPMPSVRPSVQALSMRIR